jgi:HD-GYP domain-containing protein (c-di-GMP phosphodiesterase class II)
MNPTVARIVLEHHERCDGSGYPYHLRDEDIHPLSKIVAVADIYDAMTSDRNFKKRILPHEAAEYLLAVSNSKLDQEITKIFLKEYRHLSQRLPRSCFNTNE